jgi:hypothetical protein
MLRFDAGQRSVPEAGHRSVPQLVREPERPSSPPMSKKSFQKLVTASYGSDEVILSRPFLRFSSGATEAEKSNGKESMRDYLGYWAHETGESQHGYISENHRDGAVAAAQFEADHFNFSMTRDLASPDRKLALEVDRPRDAKSPSYSVTRARNAQLQNSGQTEPRDHADVTECVEQVYHPDDSSESKRALGRRVLLTGMHASPQDGARAAMMDRILLQDTLQTIREGYLGGEGEPSGSGMPAAYSSQSETYSLPEASHYESPPDERAGGAAAAPNPYGSYDQ